IFQKPVVVLNRDITGIPCFRNSFLYGLGGGFVGGLACFLFTSNVKWSSHAGVSSFVLITMSYWFHCRWQWSKTKFSYGQLQSVMQKHTMYEGTEFDVTKKGT
ncbi:hypothetical protein C0J52_05005, partial [Blattella germanica]